MKKIISISHAKDLINRVLFYQGYKKGEVEIIAEVLLYGALREGSQGMNKLFGWHAAKDKDAKSPEISHSSSSVSRCNAKKNNGAYANCLAVDNLLTTVQQHGIAVVGTYNFNSSSGALSYYTKRIAQVGFVGIMLASADPIGGIAPKGRSIGVFGTNPLSISIPYKKSDITLDMSTAKYTWGDLVSADIQNKKLEPGFAFNNKGEETLSPKEAMSGTVGSFDGSYKGMGMAFMIQILAGALVGSVYEQSDETCDYGSLMIAIDPNRLGGSEFMNTQIEKMIQALKSDNSQHLPGEQGDARMKKNIEADSIAIDEELLEKIQQTV